jgi:hypothetical protein
MSFWPVDAMPVGAENVPRAVAFLIPPDIASAGFAPEIVLDTLARRA